MVNSYIELLYQDRKYTEIIKSYDIDEHNYTDRELLIFSDSFYKIGKYKEVISISSGISEDFKSSNFFINEIIGESLINTNRLEEAIDFLFLAIDINSKLVSAKHKLLILKARLNLPISKDELDQGLLRARNVKNTTWIRDVCYLYYSYGFFDEANTCLEFLLNINKSLRLHYLDFLSYTCNKSSSCSKLTEVGELFKIKYVDKNSKNLIVIFSPDHGFAFQGYEFNDGYDLLYLNDLTSSYYIFILQKLTLFLKETVKTKKYKTVTLIGASKAGTGALQIYTLLKHEVTISLNCLVFSPQIKIFPFNANLIIPSYQNFAKLFDIHPYASHKASKAPKITDVSVRKGDRVRVVYGRFNSMDSNEVKKISHSSGIELMPIDFSGHSSSIPFTIKKNKSYLDLKRTYSKFDQINDEDFQSLGGGKTVDLVDEIWSLYKEDTSLNNLIVELNTI